MSEQEVQPDEFEESKLIQRENEEWQESKLENLLSELLTGGRPKGGGLNEGDYISIGGTQIASEGHIDLHDLVFIPEDYFDQVEDTQLRKHDILVVKDGSNTGDVAIAWETDDRIVTNEHLFTLRTDTSINSPYLFYYLLSHKGWKQIHGTITGSAQEGINRGFTGKVDIKYPQLDEQRKIASVLYTVDQATQKTQEIIEQLHRVKLGVAQHYFEAYNTIRREENPDSVEMVELENLVEFKPGKAWKTKNLSEDGMRVVRIGNLTGETDDYWQYDGDYEERRVIEDGDLLFSWAGMKSSIGVHFYQGQKALLNQHIYNLVPTTSIGRKFLYYYLDYRMNDLYSLSQGGAVQIHLTKDIIERILVPKLDSDRRDSIVNHLEEIDCTLQNEISYRNQLRRLKQGLMQDLLSGEVRTHDKDIEIVDEVLAHG